MLHDFLFGFLKRLFAKSFNIQMWLIKFMYIYDFNG